MSNTSAPCIRRLHAIYLFPTLRKCQQPTLPLVFSHCSCTQVHTLLCLSAGSPDFNSDIDAPLLHYSNLDATLQRELPAMSEPCVQVGDSNTLFDTKQAHGSSQWQQQMLQQQMLLSRNPTLSCSSSRRLQQPGIG